MPEPTATEHVHIADKRNRALRCGFCACGAVYDEQRGTWGEPRYFDGMRRRYAWDAARAEEQRVRVREGAE